MGFEQASCQRFFNLLFIVNEKEKGGVSENDFVFEDSFAFGVSLSHFYCFFFRKRRNKRNQTEREKRRKASLAVRKSDSTGFAGLRGLVIPYPFATKNNVVQTLFFVRLVWGIQHPFQRGVGPFRILPLTRWLPRRCRTDRS